MRSSLKSLTGIALLAALGLSAACATAPKKVEKGIPEDHFAEVQRPDIPLVMNDRVQDWLNYFQGKAAPISNVISPVPAVTSR